MRDRRNGVGGSLDIHGPLSNPRGETTSPASSPLRNQRSVRTRDKWSPTSCHRVTPTPGTHFQVKDMPGLHTNDQADTIYDQFGLNSHLKHTAVLFSTVSSTGDLSFDSPVTTEVSCPSLSARLKFMNLLIAVGIKFIRLVSTKTCH